MIKLFLYFIVMLQILPGPRISANQLTAIWKTVQLSEQKYYETTIECQAVPVTGSFQSCWLMLKYLDKYIDNAKVFLNGGMPEHHHGLPTAPVVSWSKESNAYIIEGLKFSMPGNWVLNFYIAAKDLPKDQTTISININ